MLAGISIAAASVAAVDKVLAAAAPGDDPIFAAIEQHREAMRAWLPALKLHSRLEGDWFARRKHPFEEPPDSAIADAHEQEGVCCDRERVASDAMVETTPTTLAGALAAIRYVLSYYEGESEMHPGRSHDLLSDEQMLTFIATIANTLEASTGAAGATAAALPVAAAATADPIFAVLAEHRAAMKAYLSAAAVSARLVDDTPEWTAAWAVTQAAIKREHATLLAVLTTQPTTIVGAVALLEHVGQDQFLGEAEDGGGPETLLTVWTEGEECEFTKATREFPGRLAATMRSLTAAA